MNHSKGIWKNPYFSMMRIAWKYAFDKRKRYLFIYFMFALSNLTSAAKPILWGWFLNDLQMNGMTALRSAWIYAIVFFTIRLLDWVFHGPARIMERELAFDLSKNFVNELYHKALHLPVKWHQDNHSGTTINRIRKAYDALNRFFQDGFEYMAAISKFIISFAAMLYFTPLFGSIALLMGCLVVYIILKFDKPYIKTLAQVNEKEHLVYGNLFDSLSNITTVITLRLEERMEKGLTNKILGIFPSFKKNIRINEWKWFVTSMLVVLIYLVILVGYVYQNWVPGEVLLIGGLVTLISFVDRFTSVFHNLAYLYTDVVRKHTDVATAQNIFDAYDALHVEENTGAIDKNWKSLKIENLNFQHGSVVVNNGKLIQGLQNVSLQIERGKKIAFIGKSGSGKSTLLALLRGLYEPESNYKIKLDNESDAALSKIWNSTTLFPQEPEIFENTIEYNITLGLPFEKEEVEQICKDVHFSEVVEQLPKGFESSIREKGVNLSGGQRQRLALARGVFAAKDSQLVLLDEPTSSVDPKTETLIYDQLFKAFRDKAVVSALHRLHLLTKFDYIYVMENGAIIEEGTLEHLKKHGPVFQELWAHQESGVVV